MKEACKIVNDFGLCVHCKDRFHPCAAAKTIIVILGEKCLNCRIKMRNKNENKKRIRK